jgi:hypothetical protein
MSARTRRWLRRAVYVVGAFIALAMFLTATNAGGEWVFWVRWIGGLAVIGAIAAALLSPSLALAIIEELFASRGERHLKLLKERTAPPFSAHRTSASSPASPTKFRGIRPTSWSSPRSRNAANMPARKAYSSDWKTTIRSARLTN